MLPAVRTQLLRLGIQLHCLVRLGPIRQPDAVVVPGAAHAKVPVNVLPVAQKQASCMGLADAWVALAGECTYANAYEYVYPTSGNK